MNCLSVFDHFVKLVLKGLRDILSIAISKTKISYNEFLRFLSILVISVWWKMGLERKF